MNDSFEEEDEGNQATIINRIREFEQLSRQHKRDIEGYERRIDNLCKGIRLLICVGPYAALWAVHGYMPEHEYIMEWIEYMVTPLSLGMALNTLNHNHSKALKRFKKAETRLQKSYEFFKNFKIIARNVARDGSKDNETMEDHFEWLIDQEQSTGKMLLRIKHKLENSRAIPIKFDEEGEVYVFCDIFASLKEILHQTTPEAYLRNKTLFDINGFTLSSYDYISLDNIIDDVVDDYRTRQRFRL